MYQTPGITKKQTRLLGLCAAVALLAVGATAATGRAAPTPYYQVQLEAAGRMQACMDAVKGYKAERDIPLSPEDLHQTGMIGEEFNLLTTTLGEIGAKRTTANSDMAALAVKLLHQAGVQPGDTVGAGFSGSFPAMNLAVLAACDAMGVQVVYIVSMGSSVYGANNPDLTFPEMAWMLYEDGYLKSPPICYSIGGDYDVGLEMNPDMLETVLERLEAELPIPLFYEPDYTANIEARIALYEANGPIQAFIAVGGNTTSLGLTEGATSLGQGLISPRWNHRVLPYSGLVERYSAAGLPVINLLNIKKLVADYGLSFDPPQLPQPGTSAVYYETVYAWPVALGGMAALCGLAYGIRRAGRTLHRPPAS